MSNYERLISTLERFAEDSKTKPLSIGSAFDSLDRASFALTSIILVLPFMQPIPMGPFTVLGGITFAALGVQMWRGNLSPVLPASIRNIELSSNVWAVLVKVCLKIVSLCHRFTKPRMPHLIDGVQGQKIGGFVFVAAGLLMAIPFGVLPFNNMLPGLAILFFSFGQMEKDGAMTLVAFFWLIFTTIYFVAFFIGLYYIGNEALEYLRQIAQ